MFFPQIVVLKPEAEPCAETSQVLRRAAVLPDVLQMVFLVIHPIIYGLFFHSGTVLLPHPQRVICYFSSFHSILFCCLVLF